ncbi:hypothetical protein GN956_G4941 [Arapaima gigas]
MHTTATIFLTLPGRAPAAILCARRRRSVKRTEAQVRAGEMWDQGGQPWPQWPLSQQQWMQSFQHQQDPGQVDWAALAQAWIAQKESSGPPVDQPGLQSNGQDIQGLEPAPNNHGTFQGDSGFNRMWQPEWGMHGPPPDQGWLPPGPSPMDVVAPSEDSNSQDSIEFTPEAHQGPFPQNSHGFGGQPDNFSMAPMAVNQFDYQHGAAAYGPPSAGFHPPYWQQGPPQNRRDRLPGFRERQRSPLQLPVKQEPPALGERFNTCLSGYLHQYFCKNFCICMDAVKRRTLPAWIREGLEKMDREKQKKLEKERMEKQRAEMAKDQKKDDDLVDEEGDGPRLPRKSKFDSDDDDNEEDEEEVERAPARKQDFVKKSPSPTHEDQSEPEMTDEEREFQLMMLTKTLLTEVLLEVTNEEIYQVAKETHRKATKAPAKQLAQSSALASLTGLGGLGEYGSDESEEDHSAKGSDSSDTDEEELRHRIRQKQDAFRHQEKALLQQEDKRGVQEGPVAQDDLTLDRLGRDKVDCDEPQLESSDKHEVREAEPIVEKRRSRSEQEGSDGRWVGPGKEQAGRSRGSNSASPSEAHSSTSRSSSSSSSSHSSSSSSSSSSGSSRSSSRSSSPRRKRRRSPSPSHRTRQRSRSRSRNSRRRFSEREKGRERRRGSRTRSTERSSHRRNRSRSHERRSSRGRKSRSKDRVKPSRSHSRDRRRSRERRRSRSRSRRKQKDVSKDRDKRKDRSRSREKDKKKKEKEMDKKEKSKQKVKDRERREEKESVVQEDSSSKSKRRRESEHLDFHSEASTRLAPQDKHSKKGPAKTSKKYSDSESSRSRSRSPEVSKDKKSKKSKRSRSRSTEKSHKSGKKASRKHKSKSRSRSNSPSRRWR